MKTSKLILLAVLLGISTVLRSQVKVSFLIDDGFWVGVNRSMHLLAKTRSDVAARCEFREFIYSNYHESDMDYFEHSDLIFVALHNNGLVFKAKPQLLAALERGAKIYALNLSHEYDGELQEWGIHFDPWILEAFKAGGENNIMNLVLKKLNTDLHLGCPYEEIEETPLSGIYNDRNKKLYAHLGAYLADRGNPGDGRPWIGMLVGRSDLTKSQYLYMDAVIRRIEDEGFHVLPVFSSQQPGHQEEQAIRRFFLESSDTLPRVCAILSLGAWYNLRPEQERKVLEELGVPVINGIMLNTTQQEWERSPLGIDVTNRSNLVAIPELAGYINPTVSVVFEDVRGNVRIRNTVDYQLSTLLGRLRNLHKLRTKPNSGKRVALIHYSYPPGKENIGASYLNVLPKSIVSMLQRLQQEGYDTGDPAPIDSAAVFDRVMAWGRNIGTWAPAEVDRLVKQGDPVLVPVELYREWYARLTPKVRAQMEKHWGQPEEARLMVWKDAAGKSYFVIPVVRYGNIILTPQPPRGWEENVKSLYHDPLVPPPHQYVAFYLFLKYGFEADAVVHIGTHGTHEWLPGKEAGLSPDDYPEALIADVPNIYPYIVDNVGEGLQAKRRGQAVIIDHLTPPFDRATLNPELRDLKAKISAYHDLRSKSPMASLAACREIEESIRTLGIDKDLALDTIDDRTLEDVDDYIKDIEERQTPFGLHTFGRTPDSAYIRATADAVMARRRDLQGAELAAFGEQVRRNLAVSGERELAAFIDALNGKYVRAGTGNDPLRNPSSLPTGKNFFAFDPRLVPSRTTCRLGEQLAEELVERYRAEHGGEYPSKVTINLWTVECIRNEGTMEAQALSLLGVRPVYNAADEVVDLELIPRSQLRRPRVDIVFAPSGLYRDIFPELMAMLDKAVSLAREAEEQDNFVRTHILESQDKLQALAPMADSLAQRIASVRLFTAPSGAYGTGVSGAVQASGTWDDEKDVAETYFDKMSHLYGQGFWGTKVEEQYTWLPADFTKTVFKNALSDTRVALHSRSSNLYALLDNDDMFQFLGATGLAVRAIDGTSPAVMLTNLVDPSAPGQESLEKFLGRELKTRYLNPKWIDAMVDEGYAGARFINKMVFNLWGWEATLPDAVSDNDWNQIYETYIADKYDLHIQERFEKGGNLYAYQAMLARLLETVRKGYWQADRQVVDDMLLRFNATILRTGLGCSQNVCNNEKLIDYITDRLNAMPTLSQEEKERYQSALDGLRKRSADDEGDPESLPDKGGDFQLQIKDDRWHLDRQQEKSK